LRSLPPKIHEPRRRQLGVPDGVLDVAVAKVSLQRPGIVTFVGQRITASMAQHMRVRLESQLGLDPGSLDHASEPGRRERRAPLRGELAIGDRGDVCLSPNIDRLAAAQRTVEMGH
jgi:hypothetical protein